ncbi:ciliogenesis and planar polarity effector 1-like [Argonauta hians]
MAEDLILHLNVIASTNIKRKKPWSQIIWIGKEGEESLILLDHKRISLLYLPDGKTKRSIPKVSSFVADSISVNYSNNGSYFVGLLQNGSVFLWGKCGNKVWLVEGLSQHVSNWETNQDSYSIYVSDDATKILVASSDGSVYVWFWSSDSSASIKEPNIVGCWYPVDIAENIQDMFRLRNPPFIKAVFYSNVVVGCCCNCSFLFSDKHGLTIITLYLNFLSAALSPTSSFYPFTYDWMSVSFDQNDSTLSRMNDKPIADFSSDGQILAVAINTTVVNQNKILFLSPFTNTTVVSDMKGSGAMEFSSTHFSYYWISSMKWTHNNLFIVCILNSGSVCIISRLGEPIYLRTNGFSHEMGPAFFLPIHPVIIIRNENISAADAACNQPNKTPSSQKFSISTHPRLPIIICSDGFMVTVLELPCNLNCMSLIQDLVSWSSQQLAVLCKEYNFDFASPSEHSYSDDIVIKENITRLNLLQSPRSYHFENQPYTEDSDQSISEAENIENLDAGRIIFGVPSIKTCKLQPQTMFHSDIFKNIYLSLILAWKLEVTSGCIWDATKAKITKMTLLNTSKVFQLFLEVPSLSKSLMSVISDKSSLFHLIRMFREFLYLLHFDFLYQRQLNVFICFVHKTVKLILNNDNLPKSDPAIKTLLGCEALLNFTNQIFMKTYTWSSKYPPSKARGRQEHFSDINSESEDNSWYEPTRNSFETSYSRKRTPKKKCGINTDQRILNSSLQELLPTWKLLMKHAEMVAAEDFKNRQKKTPCQKSDYSEILRELFQRLNTHLFSNLSSTQDIKERPHNISKGEKYSLESRHTLAEDAWKEQLSKLKDATSSSDATSSCILHALLYTYLLRGQLAQAMEMVETLVLKDDIRAISKDQRVNSIDPLSFLTIMNSSILSPQKVPCIKNPAIRQVVQSLARYMAMYFCNMQLFIFPPNSPLPLPHLQQASPYSLKERIIPKYQQDVTSVITSSGLEDLWTVSRCLEYLLLSGLVPEAAWFSHKVGDWKAALTITAALMKHQEIFPILYERDSLELRLPECLHPVEILKNKLSVLLPTLPDMISTNSNEYNGDIFDVKDDLQQSQLTAAINSVLTAGIVCGFDLVSWLFPALVYSLQSLVSNFSANVPMDFHLPAPPFYLWQPSDTRFTMSSCPLVKEKELRSKTSALIRIVLIVLQAAELSLPLVQWYIHQLQSINKKAANQFRNEFDGPITEIPEILQQLGSVKSKLQPFINEAKYLPMFSSFRNFCGILWFLHVRDQLSLHNRQRRSYVEKEHNKSSTLKDKEWYALCEVCLFWTIHFMPFSHYIADEAWSYKVLLSVLAEIQPSVYSAQILATFCYDTEQLDSEVQEKLEILLNRWQTFPVSNSQSVKPKAGALKKTLSSEKSLSVYFQEYCCIVQKKIDKKKNFFGNFCEFLFDTKSTTEHSTNVGSFPFEINVAYIKFLDMFYDISFSKQLEEEGRLQSKSVYPLIDAFYEDIFAIQMESMPFRTMTGRHPKQSLLILSKPCKETTRFKDTSNMFDTSFGSVDLLSPKKTRGLFNRSHSADAFYHCSTSPHQVTASERRKMWSKDKASPCRSKDIILQSHRSKSVDSIPDKQNMLWSFDIDFGCQYLKLNQLVDWLIMWAKKNQVLISQLEVEEKDGDSKSALHTIVQPQLLVLALWLLERKYYPVAENTSLGKSSDQFTSSIKETSQKPSSTGNSFNNLEKKKHKKNNVPPMPKDKELPLSASLSFDKEEFKRWLRSSQNEIKEEHQSLPSNKNINKAKKKKKKKQKNINRNDILEPTKPLQFKEMEEEEAQEEREGVNQAYEYVLYTINEGNLTSELSNISLTEIQHHEGSHSDPLSVSVTSSFPEDSLSDTEIPPRLKGVQSPKVPTHDIKNNILSGTHSALDNHSKSRISEGKSDSLTSEIKYVKHHLKEDVADMVQSEIMKIIDVQNDKFKSVIDALVLQKKVNKKRNRRPEGSNKAVTDTNESESILSTDSESENQKPPTSITTRKTKSYITESHSISRSSKRNIKPPKKLIGNIREVLKELENLQEESYSTNARSSNTRVLNKGNPYNRIDLPESSQHQSNINNNRTSDDDTSGKVNSAGLRERYPLFNLNSVAESRQLLSLPPVRSISEPSIQRPIAPQHSAENPIRMPLLCLTKKQHQIFKIPEPNLCIANIKQEAADINKKKMSQKCTVPCIEFVDEHKASNAKITVMQFLQQNFKALIDSPEPEEPSPMPLLAIPKDKSELKVPQLSFQLIPPELIANFKQRCQEKRENKKKNFIKFQETELEKLKEENQKSCTDPVSFHPLELKQVTSTKEEPPTQQEVNKVSHINNAKRTNRRKKIEEMKAIEKTLPKAEPEVPAEPSSDEPEEDKVELKLKESEKIHKDFIFNPDSFNNFLKLGAELGVPTNNYAQIQYDVATRLQKLRHESQKIASSETKTPTSDVSVATDPVIEERKPTVDAATSTIKDTGTDPIPEIIFPDKEIHQGTILSPDIFMNMHGINFPLKGNFANETNCPALKKRESRQKFLNVIDISSSSVMNGITEATPIISQPLTNTKSIQNLDAAKPYNINTEAMLSDFNYKNELSSMSFQAENEIFETNNKRASKSNPQPKIFEPRILSPICEDPVQSFETPLQIPQSFQDVDTDAIVSTENEHVSEQNQDLMSSIEKLAMQILSPSNSSDVAFDPQTVSDIPLTQENSSEILLTQQNSPYDRSIEPHVHEDIIPQSFKNTVQIPASTRKSSQNFLKSNLMKMAHELSVLDKLAQKMEEENKKTKQFNEEINSLIGHKPYVSGSLLLTDESKQAWFTPPANISTESQLNKLASPSNLHSSFFDGHASQKSKPKLNTKHYEPSQKQHKQQQQRELLQKPSLIQQQQQKQHDIQPDRYSEIVELEDDEDDEDYEGLPVGFESSIQESSAEKNMKLKPDEDQEQWLKDMSILNSVSDIMADLLQNGDINLADIGNDDDDDYDYGDDEGSDSQNKEKKFSIKNMFQLSRDRFVQMAHERQWNNNNHNEVWMDEKQNKQLYQKPPFAMNKQATRKHLTSREWKRHQRFAETQEKRLHDVERLIQNFQYDQALLKKQHTKRKFVSPDSSKSSFNFTNQNTAQNIHDTESFKITGMPVKKKSHSQRESKMSFNFKRPSSKVPQPNSPTESASKISDKHISSKPKDIRHVLSSEKTYREFVRCQRPEITRKVVVVDSKPYTQRLADMKKGNLKSSKMYDKQKMYGVKDIPTDQSKPCKKESSQEVNKSDHNQRTKQMELTHKRLHKPLSYTERLKQLSNKGLSNYSTTTSNKKTYPVPQQQTSVQQATKMEQDKTPVRHHPYADSKQFPDGNLSDVSEWSLDDRMKTILYDDKKTFDQEEAHDRSSNSPSDYYDEVISAPNPPPDTNEVVASLSSCSLSSHIDWTAIEKGLTEQINS